jgi:glycosyltransferase involved in cell wall biosynthesis
VKRVLLFDARHITKGGIGVYIEHHLRGVARSEVFDEVRALCLQKNDLPAEIREAGVVPIQFAPLFSVAEQLQMKGLSRSEEKHVYFSPHVTFPLWPFCPTVLAIHDLIWLRFPRYASLPSRTYFRAMLSRATKVCAKIMCVSDHTSKDVIEVLNCDPNKVSVVHNGIDAPDTGARVERDAEDGFWLYVGSWKPWKRVPDLISAFEQFMDSTSNPRPKKLKLVGDFHQNMSDDIHSLVEHSRHRDKIELLGMVPRLELEALIRRAFAMVHPAEYEGFGFTILEAMRVGTPVISTRGGSIPEVAGSAAELVPTRNPKALAAAMLRVATDDRLRAELSEKGLQRAAEFSWKAARSRLTALLEGLVG